MYIDLAKKFLFQPSLITFFQWQLNGGNKNPLHFLMQASNR